MTVNIVLTLQPLQPSLTFQLNLGQISSTFVIQYYALFSFFILLFLKLI